MKKFLLCGILVMTLLAMTFQPAQAFAPEPAADYKPIAGSGTADAGNPGEDVTSGSALGAQVGDNTDQDANPPPDTTSGAAMTAAQAASGSPNMNTVYTAADLQAWFDAHVNTSGTVTLGGDIWLYDGDTLAASITNPNSIVVNMGDYHIYVSGGELALSGGFQFSGDGAGDALISEVGKGSVSLTNGVQMWALGYSSFTDGCCALSVFGGAELEACHIYVYGDHSTGLIFKDDGSPEDAATEITDSDITTYGDYSTAVYSELPFYAYSSYIMAGGSNSISVSAPEIHLSDDSDAIPPVNPPPPAVGTASNLDELNDWLDQNYYAGGEVTLTGDIWVSADEYLNAGAVSSAPVTIDAGGHTIYLNGGYLDLTGPVTLMGDTAGAPPLIDEISESGIRIGFGTRVAAKDRDAVRCSLCGDQWGSAGLELEEAGISASGEGVTALYIEDKLPPGFDGSGSVDIEWDRITASGDGSAAIRSELPLTVRLCVVTAEGYNAAAIDAPDMDISCSKVEPLPDSCVIAGLVPSESENSMEIPVGFPPERISLPDTFDCYCGDWPLSFHTRWDMPDIDTSVPGIYYISGTADVVPLYKEAYESSLLAEIGPQIPDPVFTVKVSKPRKPEFTDEMYYNAYTYTLFLNLKDPVDPYASKLYICDNNDNRWIDATAVYNDEDNTWTDAAGKYVVEGISDMVIIMNIYDGMTYGFKVIAGGDSVVQGASDPFWVKITDGIPYPTDGGDRTGTDRDGASASGDGQSPGNSGGNNTLASTGPSGSFGSGSAYTKSSAAGIVYTVQKDFSQFDSVKVGGGALVKDRDYKAEKGSTKITLLPSYLDSLPVGMYTLTVLFKDNTSASAQFTIAAGAKLPFTDVAANSWYFNAVNHVYANGLMTGAAADTFAPLGTITRAMIVTILYRNAGSPDASKLTNPFSDVPEGSWFTDAIKWAAKNGVVSGYGDGRFGPGDPVTKEQLAALICRAQQSSGKTPPNIDAGKTFSDAGIVSGWAKADVDALDNQGIFRDIPGGGFNPQSAATRAEAASMLYRWLTAAI